MVAAGDAKLLYAISWNWDNRVWMVDNKIQIRRYSYTSKTIFIWCILFVHIIILCIINFNIFITNIKLAAPRYVSTKSVYATLNPTASRRRWTAASI